MALSMSDERNRHHKEIAGYGWIRVTEIAMLTNPTAALGALMPTLISAFVARGTISLSEAVLLGAAEMAGMTLILVCSPLYINKYNHRILAYGAAALAASAQLLSLFVNQPEVLSVLRFSAGVGEGGLYALAIASLASTANPHRAFGVSVALNQAATLVLFAVVARLAIRYPAEGAIVVFFIFLVGTALFIPKLPSHVSLPPNRFLEGNKARSGSRPAFLGVLATFALSCGFGSVWPVIGQIGRYRNVPLHLMATTFTVVGFAGVLAGLVATILGIRLGRLTPTLLASLGLATSLALLNFKVWFPAVAISLFFFWILSIPYYLGLVAMADTSGRMAALASSMMPFGIAVSEVLSGPIIAKGGFLAVSLTGAAFVCLALLLILVATRIQNVASQV